MKTKKTWRVALLAGVLCVTVAAAAFAGNIGEMFMEFVGRRVIQTASQNIAGNIKSRDGKLESSYNTMHVILRGYEAVLIDAWGENAWDKMSCARGKWEGGDMTQEEKQRLSNWRDRLFKDGRAFLSNPAMLLQMYQMAKPSIIEGIKKAQATAEMRDYLTGISKYFTASEDARKIAEQLTGENVDFNDKLDLYAFKFAERRRVEGGSELVKMYRQIIEDLAASLQ